MEKRYITVVYRFGILKMPFCKKPREVLSTMRHVSEVGTDFDTKAGRRECSVGSRWQVVDSDFGVASGAARPPPRLAGSSRSEVRQRFCRQH